MTRIEALKELASKVEVGDWFPGLALISFEGVQNYRYACDAYNGSLNAAKSLHDAVLPKYTRSVDATVPESGIKVDLHPVGRNGFAEDNPIVTADMQCEARAWLLAIIRALISDEETPPR